jgi:hypothetical protein
VGEDGGLDEVDGSAFTGVSGSAFELAGSTLFGAGAGNGAGAAGLPSACASVGGLAGKVGGDGLACADLTSTGDEGLAASGPVFSNALGAGTGVAARTPATGPMGGGGRSLRPAFDTDTLGDPTLAASKALFDALGDTVPGNARPSTERSTPAGNGLEAATTDG